MEVLDYRDSVDYGTRTIDFAVVRTDRDTLGLHVHPDGTVEVRAPDGADRDAIRRKVRKRARWIAKQQRDFASFVQPERPDKEYLAGETHRYLGKQYRIRLHPLGRESDRTAEGVELIGQFYRIYTNQPDDSAHTRNLLTTWFRERAESVLPERFEAGCERMQPYGIDPPDMEVRAMKKRWGSCTPSRRVLLNPELIHAPPYSIDYVVVHELCHLKHPYHSDAFYDLLERVLPDWRRRKERLEKVQPTSA
jgi:predicted metal-dependent hydrolase